MAQAARVVTGSGWSLNQPGPWLSGHPGVPFLSCIASGLNSQNVPFLECFPGSAGKG